MVIILNGKQRHTVVDFIRQSLDRQKIKPAGWFDLDHFHGWIIGAGNYLQMLKCTNICIEPECQWWKIFREASV